MVSSINAGSLNLSQDQIASYKTNLKSSQTEGEAEKVSSGMVSKKLKEAEATSASTEDGSVTETSKQGDTATFSKEGMQMAQSGEAPPAAPVTTAASSGSSSTDLSGYSEEQLKSKLSSGEITQEEYNKELARRATENTEVTDTTTKALQSESAMVSQLNTLV